MNIAVILAGGRGTRMGLNTLPKQYVRVNGKPVLIYTLEKFQRCTAIDRIVLVANRDWHESILNWAEQYGISKLSALSEEGSCRQGSTLKGLQTCRQFAPDDRDIVLIHDAARPFLSTELICRLVENMELYDGCLPAIPMTDTVYMTNDGKTISSLTERKTMVRAQSPEVFRLKQILELNERMTPEQLASVNASCELAFTAGFNIGLVPGEDLNFKLTTPEDLERMRVVLNGAAD